MTRKKINKKKKKGFENEYITRYINNSIVYNTRLN